MYFQIEACVNPHYSSKELQNKLDEETKFELESLNISTMKSISLFQRQFENKRFKKALNILDHAMYNTESLLYPSPLLAAACFVMVMPLIGRNNVNNYKLTDIIFNFMIQK